MIFYPGLHQPSDAKHFRRACISINRLLTRRKPVGTRVLLDSGAFSKVARDGGYREPVLVYADHVRRLLDIGMDFDIVVAEDYMCEPMVLARTGKTIPAHQRLTVERYDALLAENLPVRIMPVLQGWSADDYVRHLRMYGSRLRPNAWVGVGSVCKRQGDPAAIVAILRAIKNKRIDLSLHGFGVKTTALRNPEIVALLASADSMAWSYAGRRLDGRSANDWRHAAAFTERIEELK